MSPLERVRDAVRRDPARACLAALVAANVALVWSLPLITGQDLPQHLSYARILADFGDPRLPFRDTFVLPARPQPYFTAYLILAPLTRLTSVLTACRILYTAYVIATAAGFAALVRALHAPARPSGSRTHLPTPWTAVLGALLPWNPIQCVGFLPFMLALPAFLCGAAAAVRLAEQGWRRWTVPLVLACAATASLHLVAAACLVAFLTLFAVARASRRAALAAGVAAASTVATMSTWHTLGERGLAELPTDYIRAGIARAGLVDGLVETFGVQWNTLAAKWGFVVATVLGPLAREAKATIAGGIVVVLAVALATRALRPAREPRGPLRARFGLAVAGFVLLAVVTPAAVRLPDDICLLDFRLYVLAFMLAVALLDPRWFAPKASAVALVGFTVVALAVWARQLTGVAGEAAAVVRLVDRLEPTDTLLALPFHDRSEYLDEDNSVTHYFPVYYTAMRGGVTSLFWGKFSHHLPVGYRPGREPARPPDWDPSKFTRAELTATSHVLVEWPDADDGDPPVSGAARLREELARGFTPRGCEGRWCLYESPPPGAGAFTASAEAPR